MAVLVRQAAIPPWWGRVSRLPGQSRVVIGITGPDSGFLTTASCCGSAGEILPTEARGRGVRHPIGRGGGPGATIETVANELTTLAQRLPERFGGACQPRARLIGHSFQSGPPCCSTACSASATRSMLVLLARHHRTG